jgi:predicted kinase
LLAPQAPRLVAIGGLSGTGKSVMAAALAPEIGRPPGAVTIRSDVTRKLLFGLDPMERLGAEGYTADATARTYDAMRETAGVALRAGYAVIADAVHAHPDEREAIAAVAADCGVPFTGLWLDAPDAARVDRVTARRNDASDAGADIARAQGNYDPGPIGWHRIDAAQPPDAVADACRMALKQNGKRSTL